MSFTGVYTQFTTIDGKHAPRILDMDLFEEVTQNHEFLSTDRCGVLGEYQKDDEYPTRSWKTYKGLGCYHDDDDLFNGGCVKNFAFDRDREVFFETFERILQFLEPFEFWHSGKDNHWPHVDEHNVWRIDPPTELGTVYKITVHPDEIVVEEAEISVSEYDIIDTHDIAE